MLGGFVVGLFFGIAIGIAISAMMAVSRDNIDEIDEDEKDDEERVR